MALSAKALTVGTTTGTTDVVSASLGFTPKVVLMFGIRTSDNTDITGSIGAFSAALERACVFILGSDAAATTDENCIIRDDAVYGTLTNATTIAGLLDAVSLDADTFTVIPDDAFGTSQTVICLALGGADLTNAYVGTFTLNAATGTQDITTPGFQADCVIFFWALAGTVNTIITGGAGLGIGVGVSSSERWAVGAASDDNVAAVANRSIVTTDLCIAAVDNNSDALVNAADYVGGIANGFRINKTAGTTQPVIGYIALKGGQYKAGTTAMRTDTNNQAVTGVGFTPSALLLAGRPEATASEGTTPSVNVEIMVGVATGTANRGAMWIGEVDASDPSESNVRQSTARCAMNQAVGTPATDEGDMDFVSFDADGFTLDQDTAAGVAVLLPYLAIGDAAAAAAGVAGTSTSNRTTRRRRR